jgi:hypothetical protein
MVPSASERGLDKSPFGQVKHRPRIGGDVRGAVAHWAAVARGVRRRTLSSLPARDMRCLIPTRASSSHCQLHAAVERLRGDGDSQGALPIAPGACTVRKPVDPATGHSIIREESCGPHDASSVGHMRRQTLVDTFRSRLNPLATTPKSIGLTVGGLVGLCVLLAAVLPVLAVQALLLAAAATGAVSALLFYVLQGRQQIAEEARHLWALSGLVLERRPWPTPGGWALSAQAIVRVHDEIRRRNFRTVVELGPGVSSILLGRAAPDVEFFGLEHDQAFVDAVAHKLREHEIVGYNLILAPLTTQMVGGHPVEWYAPEAISRLPAAIDVLIVDGPPNPYGRGARAPAWPLLCHRLHPGSLVLVDDVARSDERGMLRDWLQDGRLRVLDDRGSFALLEVA